MALVLKGACENDEWMDGKSTNPKYVMHVVSDMDASSGYVMASDSFFKSVISLFHNRTLRSFSCRNE